MVPSSVCADAPLPCTLITTVLGSGAAACGRASARAGCDGGGLRGFSRSC